MANRFFLLALAVTACFSLVNAEDGNDGEEPNLTAQQFLAEIRKPLRVDAWGEFTGRIVHKGKDKKQKGELRVRITFTPSSMHTQIVLNDTNVYALEQMHKDGGKVSAKIERPEKETPPGLFDFGIDPEDLTFSFIYWNLIEELPRQSSRLRECRVMRLQDPTAKGTVNVWFHAKHGFPMEAWWFHDGQTKPWRKLELKGAKRHANGLWFVKEMRLEGLDWKTNVTFDHVELNSVGEEEKK